MFTPIDVKNNCWCLPHPLHPSVVYTKNGVGGHHFWMVQTPFPPYEVLPYRDRYELPCIHYSDDGKNWQPIPGNPIEDLLPDEIEQRNFYSDPHLILKEGKLELYYRYTILKDKQLLGNKTLLYRRTSSDGFCWSEKACVADLRLDNDVEIWGNQIISQALVWTGNQYICWYVDGSGYVKDRHVRMVTSVDGIKWEKNTLCIIDGIVFSPWHIDVQCCDGVYIMMCYSRTNRLICLESVDGIRFCFKGVVLTPSNSRLSFFSHGLYRSCSVKVDDNYYVYFSAKTSNKESIGLLKTKDFVSYQHVNGIHFGKYIMIEILSFFQRAMWKIRRMFY